MRDLIEKVLDLSGHCVIAWRSGDEHDVINMPAGARSSPAGVGGVVERRRRSGRSGRAGLFNLDTAPGGIDVRSTGIGAALGAVRRLVAVGLAWGA